MRLAVISDTNTAESFEKIYSYFKSFSIKYKVDGIVVNGDILGIFNAKDENHKPLEDFSKVFQNAAPYTSGKLIEAIQKIKKGQELDQNSLNELSESLKDYIDERYMFVIHSLRKLSHICKVYFNLGNHESPLHDYMLHELSLVFGLEKEMLNKILSQSKERNHFEIFKNKLKEIKNFELISQKAILEKDILISGIPGLYDDGLDQEKSIAQENITKSTLNEVSKQMVKARAILIFNHIDNKTNSKPFLLEPKSNLVKEFNAIASKSQKYTAMQLLLDISSADGTLSKEEDVFINKIAKTTGINLATFKEMKNKVIANVDNIDLSEKPSEESFGITEDMEDAQKCKVLRKEFTKWNGQTNHNNIKKRKRAKEMVKIIANLRKQYNC